MLGSGLAVRMRLANDVGGILDMGGPGREFLIEWGKMRNRARPRETGAKPLRKCP